MDSTQDTLDDLIGIRYTQNGRTKEQGFDCYGLAIEVERRLGHSLPDIEKAREEDYDFDECRKLCLSKVKAKQVDGPEKKGDVVLIKDLGGSLTHIGVYLGRGLLIHCDKRFGVHIDKIDRLRGFIGRSYTWL